MVLKARMLCGLSEEARLRSVPDLTPRSCHCLNLARELKLLLLPNKRSRGEKRAAKSKMSLQLQNA